MKSEKKILIFGGNGFIGNAIVEELEREGYTCIVLDKSENKNSKASFYKQIDLLNFELVKKVIDEIASEVDGVIGAVFTAGAFSVGDFVTQEFSGFERIMDLNFTSVAYSTHALLPHLIKQGGGKLIYISSIFSQVVAPEMLAYNCSKAALWQFAKSITEDYAQNLIHANVLSPGFVRSPMLKEIQKQQNNQKWMHYLYGLKKQEVDVETIVEATKFLLVQGNSINGANIVIDGGYSIR